MQLIAGVRVVGFKSIKDGTAEPLSELTSFVGKNSSGKSNVLRALNLFFNGEVEPGKSLSFGRDHYEESPRRKIKKQISITVQFRIPATVKYRKELKALEQLGKEFSITRTWDIQPIVGIADTYKIALPSGATIEGEPDLARQFLGLIFYRYIPNRSVPSRLLKEESQAIASSIFSRMKGDKHSAALMASLTEAASRLLDTATESLQRTGSPLTKPSVATQSSIGEMLTMSGFNATGEHGLTVQDEEWGSGHQAFFLYEVLKTLDTSYGRFFGWRQATIWGVEEPESALHRDLESKLAGQFREWAAASEARLQILLTTHSPIFTMCAEGGYWVKLVKGATQLIHMDIPMLAHASETEGVGGWVHPVLYFPWNPVVLVEGSIDVTIFEHVARVVGLGHIRFVSLPDIDQTAKRGGKDAITQFLKTAKVFIRNRGKGCPFLVLADWDVSDQEMAKMRAAYGNEADRYVLRMDPELADPVMSEDFRGIERFYPPKVLYDADAAGELILGIKDGKPLSVSASQLQQAKGALSGRLRRVDEPELLKPLIQNLLLVTDAVNAESPLQLKLKV